VPKPYSWDAAPPMTDSGSFIKWMQEHRGEDPRYLHARFDRFQNMVGHVDLWEPRNKRAFLMVPREEFLPRTAPGVVYDVAQLTSRFQGANTPLGLRFQSQTCRS
jgi:protein-L-isoaspartate(D-aspartate) O-methyltransferase